MARPSLSRADRMRNVHASVRDLPDAVNRALAAERNMSDANVCGCAAGNAEGITERECGCAARKAWESVEALAATAHRQSRILAGKSRGG